jgi:HPt (histidine-containing phosphotransfer) domain-containing protein
VPDAAVEETSSLPELPGVDTRSGLARVGGKVSVYRKILQQFAKSQADAPAGIFNALQKGDRVTAEREAHTLKGVAGNIGAGEVEAAAANLETAIKQGADTDALLTALEGILGELVDSLESLTSVSDATGEAFRKASVPDLLPLLDRLQALLEDSDSEAGDLVSEVVAQLAHTEFAQPIEAIGKQVDDFEFDHALERLNALRAVMIASVTDSTRLR